MSHPAGAERNSVYTYIYIYIYIVISKICKNLSKVYRLIHTHTYTDRVTQTFTIHLFICLSLSLSLYIYIYVYIYIVFSKVCWNISKMYTLILTFTHKDIESCKHSSSISSFPLCLYLSLSLCLSLSFSPYIYIYIYIQHVYERFVHPYLLTNITAI